MCPVIVLKVKVLMSGIELNDETIPFDKVARAQGIPKGVKYLNGLHAISSLWRY